MFLILKRLFNECGLTYCYSNFYVSTEDENAEPKQSSTVSSSSWLGTDRDYSYDEVGNLLNFIPYVVNFFCSLFVCLSYFELH